MNFLNENKNVLIFLLFLIQILGFCTTAAHSKVVDFGLKLPEFIQEHPSKSWLIKFYAPWCYHCQRLEPTFINVAEKIYHRHDNLIVGRVDCTKFAPICEKYGVQSYPSIVYLNQNTLTPYKGDRSEDSLIDFAERLNGPDVKTVNDCNHLKSVTNNHGLVVLSTEKDISNESYKVFKSLASSLKSTYWFYHFKKTCNFIKDEGLYILKRHLHRAIKFKHNSTSTNNLKKAITEWIVQESFPVYGSISSVNFDRTLSLGKLLVVAILDEYKPAKKFSQSSSDFHKSFETFAKKYVQHDEQLLFAWSSDLELIQSIVIGQVVVPNVMLLKSDLSHHLLIKDSTDLGGKENELPEKLKEKSIKILITAAKLDELTYDGGNTYLYRILRQIYSQYIRLISMYKVNPLLATILIGLPSVILLFVIYTTCFYDGPENDEAHNEDNSDDDEQQLLNHAKQD